MVTKSYSSLSRVVPVIFAVTFLSVSENAYAMHIMEGFLPKGWSLLWFAFATPFVIIGFFSIKKIAENSNKHLLLLALCGAFAFVLSALKLPSVTGSCSHPTGVALGAIIFGPFPMAVIGTIILLFQALLLAHGGLTTLGANVFSMAVVGSFVAFGIYKIILKMRFNAGVAVFAAAFLGDLITYVTTSFQLAAAFPNPVGGFGVSLIKFLSIFALTQLPLAVSEGLLSVMVYNILVKYSPKELTAIRGVRI